MKKHFLFLSALALFLSSCEIFSSLSEKTGAISIKMPEGSERIAETYDVNEITSFTAELYDTGNSPVAKVSSAPGKSITFESLTPGSYAIVIKAFKSTECAAYAEKSGIVVEAGATTYETITLFKNIIKNIESVEIAKESLDKITKNYTVGQTFALPDNVSIIAHFIHGYEKELEPDDYEIYICNAEQFAESSLVKDLTLSAKARFAAVGICTESGNKYSAPVSLVMNAEEPVVTWTIPAVNDNAISFELSAKASGEISYIWEKAKTADMAGKTACTSEINMPEDGTVALPLKDDSGADVYYVCTVTNTNSAVNGTTTASRQTAVFSSQMENFTVTFNLNYDGSTITTQDVASGSAVEKPEVPTRDGYTFAGWYTDADCSTEYNFKASVTGNITLYAKWTVEVITDWDTLSVKLNSGTDVGNIYVSGEFDVTSTISFSGTANIISTGTGVTFSRKKGYASDFFSLYSASLTFKGSESAPIVFDGTFETQTSNLITNGGTTTFEYCSFKNNSSSTFASVYLLDNYDSSNTTFRFCSFTGNKGPKGGAVHVGETAYNVCFENCRFENNTSSSDGGAVYIAASATVTFSNCTFNNNEASDCGGAVYIKAEATGTFSNCTFKSNTASYYGGAVYIESTGTGSFSDCTFEGNSANTRGGAIDSSGTADITNCTFTSNKTTNTTGYGGAINIDSGTMTISSITCSGNTATTGKDIYISDATLNIGGRIGSSIDIYMYNNSSSPVLVPVKGITLADETYPINVEMYECSAETTVLTQSAGMTTSDFAAAVKCFTLKNEGFVIGSNGKAETEPTEPTGMPVSSFSELKDCLNSYSDNTATANIVISGDIEITETVTINCNVNINADTAGRTLSRGANFKDALFQIGTNITGVTVNVGESGGTLTIDGNGNTVTASRSLINAGSSGNTVKISKKAILQNNVTSGTHGAAIYAKDSTVIIEGGTVQNNDCSAKSGSYGGAIYATNFEMSSGYLCGNKSVDAGGVYVLGSANITGGTISNNTASNYGGGIYLVNVTNSSISGVTFESNTGTTRGGAIYIAGTSTVDITDCTFTSNVSQNGEAIAFAATGGTTSIGGTITITDSDNILLYYSSSVLNISKSLVSTYSIPLTISTVTPGHQYITASDGILLSNEISKFSLQNEGYTLTETGVVQ